MIILCGRAHAGEGLPQLISTVRDIALASLSKGQFWFRPDATARGVVMNLMKAKGQGYVLKVRLEDGTLSVGDLFVAGEWSGKVRALYDENGSSTKAIAAGEQHFLFLLFWCGSSGFSFERRCERC